MTIMNFFMNTMFEIFYRTGTPPWVIGRAQPDLIKTQENGEIHGTTILDVGCGTGENATYLAMKNYVVTGVDISKAAIMVAKEKARVMEAKVDFHVADAFALSELGKVFDVVIDYGLFHQFKSTADIDRYVNSLRGVLKPGGQLLLQCFSNQEARREFGPRRVTESDIYDAFKLGWKVDWIRPAIYVLADAKTHAAWLASITKIH